MPEESLIPNEASPLLHHEEPSSLEPSPEKGKNHSTKMSTSVRFPSHRTNNSSEDETTRIPEDPLSEDSMTILQPNYIQSEQVTIPKSVFFIIGNEFCERFTFYGIKAILYMYLTKYMMFSNNNATALNHSFNMLAYACTLIGGVLSDGYLGRFRTIVYLSLVYCVGNMVLSITAIPGTVPVDANHVPVPWGMALGLLLLAFGTGGIKPCVAAFGGDQFLPSQVKSISVFFSLFYFAINSGSLFSMLITPKLRTLQCFGMENCYPLAFGIPSGLMLVSTLIFISGHKFYRYQPPTGNVLTQVLNAIWVAWRNRSQTLGSHWLDAATLDPRFTPSFLKEVKQLLAVLWIFLPLPIFWALYDQQGTRWIAQAMKLNSTISWGFLEFSITPDQMQAINAFLILAFIPLFQQVVYPKFTWLNPPLRKIPMGMALVGSSFLIAAALEWKIEKNCPYSPDKSYVPCVSILWQVPQYVVLTAGEIMFSITGLEFAFRQSPNSLKGVCQAAWQLTVAFGNLIVVIVAETSVLPPIQEFTFFAILLFLASLLFIWMSRGFSSNEQYQVIETDVHSFSTQDLTEDQNEGPSHRETNSLLPQ